MNYNTAENQLVQNLSTKQLYVVRLDYPHKKVLAPYDGSLGLLEVIPEEYQNWAEVEIMLDFVNGTEFLQYTGSR